MPITPKMPVPEVYAELIPDSTHYKYRLPNGRVVQIPVDKKNDELAFANNVKGMKTYIALYGRSDPKPFFLDRYHILSVDEDPDTGEEIVLDSEFSGSHPVCAFKRIIEPPSNSIASGDGPVVPRRRRPLRAGLPALDKLERRSDPITYTTAPVRARSKIVTWADYYGYGFK